MILFACDLDNTIIHSYKKASENDVCVEKAADGKKLSYMTQEAYEFFGRLYNIKNLCIIPVTTRSVEQYMRIRLLKDNLLKYAVTSNGGNLLIDNIPDKEWYNESLELVSCCIDELKKAGSIIDIHNETQFPSRLVDGLFVYTKSNRPDEITEILRNSINTDIVSVFSNGQKIYAVPSVLSKGTAVKRLIKKFGFDFSVSSGDSLFDIPMLSETDAAILPSAEFAAEINSENRKIINPDNCNFAEFICRNLKNICEEFNYETF